ncbi:MAG: PKD domain-containing protein [Acidobacteriota bacterium]
MKIGRPIGFAAVVVIVFAALPYLLLVRAVGGFATTFYDLDVVAVSGQNGLTSLFAAPSINDQGLVSFTGKTGGFNVFISAAPASYTSLNGGGTNNVISGNSQISIANQIITLETIIGLNQQLLRVWDGNATNTSTVVAGSTTAFNDFAAVRPNASINNGLQPVFSAQAKTTFQTLLVTGTRTTTFNQTNLPHPLKPMIADDGHVIVRAGNTITSPILLYPLNLLAPVTIASSTDFTQLGDSPGISDDGKIVVFFGDAKPINSLGLTTGPGMFASVDEGTPSRKVLRISGRPAELGHDAAGNPIGFNAASYSAFNRVTVTHQELTPLGLDGDSFTVCFQGAPNAVSPEALFTINSGLWTVRTDAKLQNGTYRYRTFGPIPVAQIGDIIDGRTITDIVVNDAIANATTDTIGGNPRSIHRGENRVTFFASTTSGDIVVRGTYFDTDEDGLPDHWEMRGVDFGGGPIDLAAMGASPTHKDIFVHAEWMEPNAGVTFRPKTSALNAVITAFRRAPVLNPDGQTGINLHIDAGPDSIMDPRNGKKWKARSLGGNVHAFQQFIVPFNGAQYVWSGFDQMKAAFFDYTRRGPVFHYALFANRYGLGDLSGGTSTGVSRGVPSSDLIVTLGARPTPGGTHLDQVGSLMHELGHNLGLRHGGDENLPNYKPNYLSVMNYSYTLRGFVKANLKLEFNYSTRKLPPINDLDELNLDESVGISDPDNHRTIWFDQNHVRRLSGASPVVDWFFNGLVEPSVAVDINGDGSPPAAGTNVFHGFNDWPALTLNGGRTGTGAAGADTTDASDNVNEPSSDELENNTPLELRQLTQCSVEENVALPTDAVGNAPLAVTFDASASIATCGTIVSYAWTFGDGNTGTGPTVVHTYTTPGSYLATLALTDSTGNTNLLDIDYPVIVNPAGTCSYALVPESVFVARPGSDSLSIKVAAPAGCAWTAVSNNTWINILAGDSGIGDGAVYQYVVRANSTGSARFGSITIGGQTFVVLQNDALTSCPNTISPVAANIPAAGGTGSVNVAIASHCAWQALSNQSWLTITSGNMVIGNGRATYSVAPNPGPSTRKANITIGNQTFNIKQVFP